MALIILDPGSTHDGDLSKAKELVSIAASAGADAIKFQLLSPAQFGNGNISMDWNWLPELIALGKEKGIEVFASVFDKSGVDWLRHCGCKSIKFAYSQMKNLSWLKNPRMGETIYLSCDVMNMPATVGFEHTGMKDKIFKYLYCVPEYPVKSVLSFEGLFPRFDGFSSHCLGISQEIKAVEAGAKYLEFHIQGDWYSGTPDGRFAKKPKEAEALIGAIRNGEVKKSSDLKSGILESGMSDLYYEKQAEAIAEVHPGNIAGTALAMGNSTPLSRRQSHPVGSGDVYRQSDKA